MMLFNVGSANEIRKLVFKSYTAKHFTTYVCSTSHQKARSIRSGNGRCICSPEALLTFWSTSQTQEKNSRMAHILALMMLLASLASMHC